MLGRIVLALLVVGGAATARAGDAASGDRASPTAYELARAGDAYRFETSHGAVHVWVPVGYNPATAATVLFVHGYYTDVDHAWERYRLPEQFAASGINAMFVACEAPSGDDQEPFWRSARQLVRAVRRGVDRELPRGPTVAVGHSGAHRTIRLWLDEPTLDTIVLLDAAYGKASDYRRWLRRHRGRRLIDVGDLLLRESADRWHREIPTTRVIEGLPPPEAGALPAGAREARVLYIRSSEGHMPLVTRGVALPMVLRALRAPELFAAGPLTPIDEDRTATAAGS